MTAAPRQRSAEVRANARLLSAVSMEHGTPPAYVDFARHVLGGIDLDPCSSSYWNTHTVQAARFYDFETNGLEQRWTGRVFLNPAGADEERGTKSLVRDFWERLVTDWRGGLIDGAIWLGYSVQQLGQLQGSPAHPLQFPTLVPCERMRFLCRPWREEPGPNGKPRRVVIPGPPVSGDAPMHFNFVTLLPSRRFDSDARAQLTRFRDRGSSLGALVRSL